MVETDVSFVAKPVFCIRRSVTGLATAEGTAEAGISFMMKPVFYIRRSVVGFVVAEGTVESGSPSL